MLKTHLQQAGLDEEYNGGDAMNLFKKKKNNVDVDSMINGVDMVTVSEPASVNTEQFNTIRTNIQFSSVDSKVHSLMITSSTMSEGKSTISANLAASFAKQGYRTLLVDADFRRPTIKSTFKVASSKGITNYLTTKEFSLNDITFRTTERNLFVMPSGPIPPNPSELLGSSKMKKLISAVQEQMDIVIFDAPPILSVTDAQVLATNVDATILVVRKKQVQREEVAQAVELLNHVHGKILGTIFNDVPSSTTGYYEYYGYYGVDKNSNKL